MPYEKAKRIADSLVHRLRPFCQRCEIGGDVRQRFAEVERIKIVVVPEYSAGRIRSQRFVNAVYNLGLVLSGKLGEGKQLKIRLEQGGMYLGIDLELSIAELENFGFQLLQSTGPSEFYEAMLSRLKASGYTSQNGYPTKQVATGESLFGIEHQPERLELKEEEDVFEAVGLAFIEPCRRGEIKVINKIRKRKTIKL